MDHEKNKKTTKKLPIKKHTCRHVAHCVNTHSDVITKVALMPAPSTIEKFKGYCPMVEQNIFFYVVSSMRK